MGIGFRLDRSAGNRLLSGMVVLALSACATLRSYNAELDQTLSLAAAGKVDAAIRTLEKNNKKDRKDLLYYFELGELQRLRANYAKSQTAWRTADTQVLAWEDAAKADPALVSGAVMSYILNDKLRPYEGHDYEKVMLTTRLAMNHLAQGDFQNARVAIKRTHEREALIAEVRSRERQKLEEEARKRGIGASFKDLSGYPVQTIDSPEVNALRNSYQSAFSHYLAGFVYEALGEPSLAAAGYRQAIELRPNVPILEEALSGLDQRVMATDDGKCDVLIAVETGLAPARVSRRFTLPIPVNERLVLVPISFPVIQSQDSGFVPSQIRVEGSEPLTAVQITSVDVMARRALQDEMPAIMLRGFVRSFAKATAQYQAQRAADLARQNGDDTAGAMLDLAGYALAAGSVATETADERQWRSLPARVSIARARVPRGKHRLILDTPFGPHEVQVNMEGRHAFVALRLVQGALFTALPKAPLAGAGLRVAPVTGSPSKLEVSGEASTAPTSVARSAIASQFNPEELSQ